MNTATPNLIHVPLSKLIAQPSPRNVRKSAGQSIATLAESIARIGLLQNLTVSAAPDGKRYEVVAGGRRLAALKSLAKERRIAKTLEIPCLLVSADAARTVSLTENVQREAMHPADQFDAFAALITEGRSIEDIAADFAVTPLVVQRRLKLANVSPRLMEDYRADEVSLDQLMALAITDDHAAQEAAFYDAPTWQRSPYALRQRLTAQEIDSDHPIAQFVGLQAYEAAGGAIRRDLFSDDDNGVYLTDAALLDKLAQDKLAGIAEDVRAEGWAWVDVTPAAASAELYSFQHAPKQRREPTEDEALYIEILQAKLDELAAAVDATIEAEDEEQASALQEEIDGLHEKLEGVQAGLMVHSPEIKAVAGVIITIDRNGQPVIHRGLLREADAKALRKSTQTATHAQENAANEDAAADIPAAPALSDRLAQRLSAHRTAALQIELVQHPHVALAALVHGMVQDVLQGNHYGHNLPLGVRLTVQNRMADIASDWPESPASVALRDAQQQWREKLPEDSENLFAALLAMEQNELVKLLAVCTAATVDVVTHRATSNPPGQELARAVNLDMAAWWTPTADSYFQHLNKAAILQAVGEFAPEHVNRLAKLKKADIASEAERLSTGTGWMPECFKAQTPPQEAADETAQDVDTVIDEAVALLAA